MSRLVPGRAGPLAQAAAEARAQARNARLLAELMLLLRQGPQLQAASRGQDTADKAYTAMQRIDALVAQLGLGSLPNVDGNTYRPGPLTLVNSTNVVLVNTGLTNVVSGSVAAGAYTVRGEFLVSVGANPVALTMGLGGPSVGPLTQVRYKATYEAQGGESVFAGHTIGALGTINLPSAVNTFPNASVVHVWISGYITFTAGGALTFPMQITVASATTQASLGGTLELKPA